ncbi:MAG: hypothetical protein ACRDEA_13955 [Microcystaceae cyanobacterium]
MVLANLLWDHSGESLELLRQMALTRKPSLESDVGDRQIHPVNINKNASRQKRILANSAQLVALKAI